MLEPRATAARKPYKRLSLKQALERLKEAPTWEVLTRTGEFLSGQHMEGYLVGGLVRDILLNRETKDIDIAVIGNALEVAKKVAEALGGSYVPLDEQNRVGRVVLHKWDLDFSSIDENIETDLARRDFTVNAMAIDLSLLIIKGKVRIIDPFKGFEDLRQRLIRAITKEVFTADAVRLLRAVRLGVELRFSIERMTKIMIKRDAPLITTAAGERLREELLRIMAMPDGDTSLHDLDKLGLLSRIFPEIAAGKGMEQPKEHEWDVFKHSLKTAAAVDFLLRQGECEYQGNEVLTSVPWGEDLANHFDEEVSHGSTRRILLKLAGLLHDIAKPRTRSFEAGGRVRFFGHAQEGASLAASMLTRLRFSIREIRLITTEIEHHMRPGQIYDEKFPTQKAIYRFFRDTGDAGIDVLFLNLADHLATRGHNLDLDHWRQHTGVIEYVLNKWLEQETLKLPLKLVDGNDLIKRFGLPPGPKIGEMLEAVREAQAAGEIRTREQAMKLIKRLLSE